VWLRRDLRLADHTALDAAARRSEGVVTAFVLDPGLLRGPRVGAPIVQFFFDSLRVLRATLRQHHSDLALLEGDFADQLCRFAEHIDAQAVFYNADYDPEMRARDARVADALRRAGLAVHEFVDHVYAAADDVLQDSGKPYTVFTPYRRRWHARFDDQPRVPIDSEHAMSRRPKTTGTHRRHCFRAAGCARHNGCSTRSSPTVSTRMSIGATCPPSPEHQDCRRICERERLASVPASRLRAPRRRSARRTRARRSTAGSAN
jgi:deoxyribodipyrimidine photolyase